MSEKREQSWKKGTNRFYDIIMKFNLMLENGFGRIPGSNNLEYLPHKKENNGDKKYIKELYFSINILYY